MHKIHFFLILFFLTVGCTSQPTVKPTPSPSPNTHIPIQSPTPTISEAETDNNPKSQIFRQAQLIRTRLRYFGEELKTTYKLEKQKALMENVREYIKPAYEEIENTSKENKLDNNSSIKAFLEISNKLDRTLATYDPKALPPILKDFNLAFENLQSSLTNKENNKK